MNPNNDHSNKVFSLLCNFGKDNIQSWNITLWNPWNENVVNFCVDKFGFLGTISIEKLQSIQRTEFGMFIVAFQGVSWKVPAVTVLEGDKIAEFITQLGGVEKKWSAGIERTPQAKGERAPQTLAACAGK